MGTSAVIIRAHGHTASCAPARPLLNLAITEYLGTDIAKQDGEADLHLVLMDVPLAR